MNDDLRRRFVRDLVNDLEQVGGARFESAGSVFFDALVDACALHRGLNIEGAPVAGPVDSVTVADQQVGEYSSRGDYFESPFRKLLGDIRKARQKHPACRIVHLFSSRQCPTNVQPRLLRLSKTIRRIVGITVHIYDSRHLAELIVDRLLAREQSLARLETFLPSLKRIGEQYAMSHTLPKLSSGYRGRQEQEHEVLQILGKERLVAVWGLAGIGKSAFAISLAQQLAAHFDSTIWLSAEELSSVAQLRAIDILRNGSRQNLMGLLRQQRTLLVLDNLMDPIDLDELRDETPDTSRIVVTTQAKPRVVSFSLPMLDRSSSTALLADGVLTPCPADIAEKIWDTVGGHPLVLRIMNALATQDGFSWDDLAADCSDIGSLEDDRRQILANRLLERHASVARQELAFVAWCGRSTIDRGLLRHAVKPSGIQKLEVRGFTTGSPPHVLRLHDIVFRSMHALRTSLFEAFPDPVTVLTEYLAPMLEHRRLALYRVIHLHRSLIRKCLREGVDSDVLRYAYILSSPPGELDASLLRPPEDALTDIGELDPSMLPLRIVTTLETVEALYRRQSDRKVAKVELAERLVLFDQLLAMPSLDDNTRQRVRHHRGKALIKLGKRKEALRAFEDIVRLGPAPFATRLQIARIPEADTAWAQLCEIFESELQSPGSVPTSVLLEAGATLARKHLDQHVEEATTRYGALIAKAIRTSACTGFDQPLHTFAAIGRKWWAKSPELFLQVYENFSLAEETVDLEDMFSVAEIHKAAGKVYRDRNDLRTSTRVFRRAAEFYARLKTKTPFEVRAEAENFILLGLFEEAGKLLDGVPTDQRNEYWSYRRAQAWEGVGDRIRAIDEAEAAIAKESVPSQYTDAFRQLVAQLKRPN